jgi:hypothetical protein
VGSKLQAGETQIKRIEDGATDTSGSTLMTFCRLVNGNPTDIEFLMLDEQATAEDGVAAADSWISLREQIDRWLKEAPDLEGVIVPGRISDIADDIRSLIDWLKRVLHQNGSNGSTTPESPTRQ